MSKQFIALIDFKSGLQPGQYESGNTYKSHDLSDELVNAFQKAGFLSLDGVPNNDLNPSNVIVVPDDVVVQGNSVI